MFRFSNTFLDGSLCLGFGLTSCLIFSSPAFAQRGATMAPQLVLALDSTALSALPLGELRTPASRRSGSLIIRSHGSSRAAQLGGLGSESTRVAAAAERKDDRARVVFVSSERPRSGGKIDEAAVQRVIRTMGSALHACYSAATRENLGFHGKITLEMEINEAGRLQSVKPAQNTLPSPQLTRCIIDTLMRGHFPPSEGGLARISNTFVVDPS